MGHSLDFTVVSRERLIAGLRGWAADAPDEIRLWDIDIRPNGEDISKGGGTATNRRCSRRTAAPVIGECGQGGIKDRLFGGQGTLASVTPVNTVGSFWPYATRYHSRGWRARKGIAAAGQDAQSRRVHPRGGVRPVPARNEMARIAWLALAAALALTASIWVTGAQAMAAEGLITIRSSHGPEETMNRFEAEVRAKGMTVFAHIDHAAGAAEVGLSLRPTELLIFGNARGGTPLMQADQSIGIDLPLKVLVWQDASDNTWLSYDDPSWIAKRHGLGHEVDATVRALAAALNVLAGTATRSP
jgi:uncharacterized protein (DUF302 family)